MLAQYVGRLRMLSRDARLFLAATGCIGLAYYGGAAVLQNLFILRLGYGPKFIGLVFAVGSFMPVVFSLPAQVLSRRWGVRKTMILGMIVMPLGAFLLPVAEMVPAAWRAPTILGASALSWMGGPLFMVNAGPFLAGSSGPEERAYAFSIFGAVFPFAGFFGGLVAGALPALFGPLLGVPLDHPTPFRIPLWLAATLYVPGIVAMVATRGGGEPAGQERRPSGRAPMGIILVIGVVSFVRMAAAGALQSFFNVYLDAELGAAPSTIGAVMATGQLVGGLAALSAPVLIGWWGKRKTFVSTCAGVAVGYLPLGLVPSLLAAGASFLGITVMTSISQPTLNVFGQEAVAPRWRTAVSTAAVMAMGLGYSVAGLVGGQAIGAVGYRSFFSLSGLLPALGALVFWAYFRPRRGRADCVAPVEVL